MATISIKVSDEQAAVLPLRVLDDFSGDKETVAAYCQRIIDSSAALGISQKRQRDFDSLSVEQKDKALEEGKKT